MIVVFQCILNIPEHQLLVSRGMDAVQNVPVSPGYPLTRAEEDEKPTKKQRT